MYVILYGDNFQKIKQLTDKHYDNLEDAIIGVKKYVSYTFMLYNYEFLDNTKKDNIITKAKNNTLLKEDETKYYIFEHNNFYEIMKFTFQEYVTNTIEKKIIIEEFEETKFSYFYGKYTETVEIPIEKEVLTRSIDYETLYHVINNIKIIKIITNTEFSNSVLDRENVKLTQKLPDDFHELLQSKRDEIFNKRKFE